MAQVVGIAGVPGAGKSTLVAGLARTLPSARTLHMDAYENMTQLPIEDVARWQAGGADIDAFDFPRLQAELARLKGEGAASGCLLFETQFGRAHRATGRHIDFLIWVDTPLDVALARNVRVLLSLAQREPAPARVAGHLQWLQAYLENYLGTVRGLLEMQRERVAGGADLVIDGTRPAAETAGIAARAIAAKLA